MNETTINAIWPGQNHIQPANKEQAKEISKNFSEYMKESAADKSREMILVQKDNHASALRKANEYIDENGTDSYLLLQEEESGDIEETRAHMSDVARTLYNRWQK